MNARTSLERQYLYFVLLLSKGIGPAAVLDIRQMMGSSDFSEDELGHELLRGGLPNQLDLMTKHRDAILQAQSKGARDLFKRSLDLGQFVICPDDDILPRLYWERSPRFRLPSIFIAIGDPPPNEVPWIAVIGSRNASDEGLGFARSEARTNAQKGFVTVSGGARGVDVAATEAALTSNGSAVTVAAQEVAKGPIEERHMIISPYAPGTQFSPGLAMARNGVVVGLVSKVVIAEVRPGRSGAPSGTEHAIGMANKFEITIYSHQAIVE